VNAKFEFRRRCHQDLAQKDVADSESHGFAAAKSLSKYLLLYFRRPCNRYNLRAQLYIEYRMTAQRTRLLRHLVQTGVMAWAVWICSSRILDFKHRFSDVAAGIVIGTTVAVCMVSRLFSFCTPIKRIYLSIFACKRA